MHAERLADGRLLITTVPLLYGTYTVTHGTATFSLEPPNDLNFAAGWPLFKEDQRRKAEIHYGTFLASAGRAAVGSVPIAGITTSANDAATNELIRVEPAVAAGTPKMAVATPPPKFGTPASTPSTKTVAQNRKASPSRFSNSDCNCHGKKDDANSCTGLAIAITGHCERDRNDKADRFRNTSRGDGESESHCANGSAGAAGNAGRG